MEFLLTKEKISQLLNSIFSKKKRFKIYRLEEQQRSVNEGKDLIVQVILKKDLSTKVEEEKNHDKILQIKKVKVTTKIHYQNG